MRIALRQRGFRRLAAAATVDACGSWLLVMAVPVQVFALTGSATSTGLTLAVEALPAVLVGPWAGVSVDRWPRRALLVAGNLTAAAGVAFLLPATAPGRVGFVYIGLLVENVALCFLRPAISATTPALVGTGPALADANALLSFVNGVLRLAGPPVGTFLVARGWFRAAVLADLASYLVAAAILAGLSVRAAGARERRPRLREGLSRVARTPLLRGLLTASWVYWTANAGLTVLLVPFAVTRLHGSGQAVGYLIAGLGAGYIAGSVVSRALVVRYSTRTLIGAAYAAVGCCFLVAFTATALPVALAALATSGVPGAVAQVATAHRLQASTPDAELGRVSAAFYASDAVAAVAGAMVAPAVVALVALLPALVALSAAVLLASALALAMLPGGHGVAAGARDDDDPPRFRSRPRRLRASAGSSRD